MVSLPDPERSRVVLVGASTYVNLPDLPAVANNLSALAACFLDPSVWGLPPGNLQMVVDPSASDEMLDPLHDAADGATDTVVFYYAGHGLMDSRSSLHLALRRSVQGRAHTSTPYDWVRESLVHSAAARRVVILDCCYSGRALGAMSDPATDVVDDAEVEGTFVLAAAAENKRALAPPGEEFTAFTGELLALLRHGDVHGPALWDLNSIYRRVRAELRAKSRPEPQKRDRNTAGELAIARNVAWQGQPAPQPTPQPPPPQPPVPTQPLVTPQQVLAVDFAQPAAGARGYNSDQVNSFLDLVEAKLRDPGSSGLRVSDVQNVAFSLPSPGSRGYDEFQVDTFLDLVRDEFLRRAAEAPSRAQEWVGPVDPPAVPTVVPAVVPVAAPAAEPGPVRLTATDVRNAVFAKPPIGRRGFDEDQVDAFLDLVEAALQDPASSTLTADAVRDARFAAPPLGKRGYHEGEVRAFLDLVEADFRLGEG